MTRRADQGGGWEPTGFGGKLRALREAAGLTQLQFAGRAGLSVRTVTALETGAQEPAWPLVILAARALGVSTAAFEPKEGEVIAPAERKGRGRPRKQGAPPQG